VLLMCGKCVDPLADATSQEAVEELDWATLREELGWAAAERLVRSHLDTRIQISSPCAAAISTVLGPVIFATAASLSVNINPTAFTPFLVFMTCAMIFFLRDASLYTRVRSLLARELSSVMTLNC
jgi:hypothetical protein